MTEEERAIYYRHRQEYKEKSEEKHKEIAEWLENYKPRRQ